jgi:hypothetical protein
MQLKIMESQNMGEDIEKSDNGENAKDVTSEDGDQHHLHSEEDLESNHGSDETRNEGNLPNKAVLRNVEGMGSMTSFDDNQMDVSVSSDQQSSETEQKTHRSRSLRRTQQLNEDEDSYSSSPPPPDPRRSSQGTNTHRGRVSYAEPPPLLESHSSTPGAYHVGSAFARPAPSVRNGRGGGQDSPRYHGELSDGDLIEDGDSTATSVLAAVLPRYGLTSDCPAPLPPGRLTLPSPGRTGSEGSQLSLDTNLNSLVPADSTPNIQSHENGPPSPSVSVSPSRREDGSGVACSSPMAVVEAHVVVEQPLEERVAAEIEARLKEEFQDQVEQEVNRKLGAIATAEVVVPNEYVDFAYTQHPQGDGNGKPPHFQGGRYNWATSPEPGDNHGEEGKEGGDASAEAKDSAERRRWMPRIVFAFLVGLAAAGSFVAVRLVQRDDDGGDVSPTISPTLSPPEGSAFRPSIMPFPVAVMVPTSSPQPVVTSSPSSIRYYEMRQALLTISNEDDLDDESSPQYQAMEWLVNSDGLQLDPVPSYGLYQRYIAVVLYFATEGELWKQQFRFLTNTSICSWNTDDGRGLFCREGTEELEAVALSGNRLREGPLPPEIGSLLSLETFNVGSNNLGGTIPPTLGGLTNLTLLSLSTNRLTGTLPSQLQEMLNLRLLDASNNVLNGPIPNFSNFSNLEEIYLEDNRLTGSLSDLLGESAMEGLSSLKYLSLSQNQITGTLPSSICNLKKLIMLSLWSNDMTGQIPSCVGEIETIGKLRQSCKTCTTTRVVCDFLVSSKLLTSVQSSIIAEHFYVDGNSFTGSIEFFCPLNSSQLVLADCFDAVQCSCCIGCCDNFEGCAPGANQTEFPSSPPSVGQSDRTLSPTIVGHPSASDPPSSGVPSNSSTVRYSAIREVLLDVTSATVLDDPSSPQHLTMVWLVEDDLLQVDPTEEDILIQRYIVSLLYFAMNGSQWTLPLKFLNATSVCEWNSFVLGCFCFKDGSEVIESIFIGESKS